MQLREELFIGGDVATVNESPIIRLEYRTPGRAEFLTDIKPLVGGIVAYNVGYNLNLERVFTGIVQSYQQSGNLYLVSCRELTSVLSGDLPLSLRHVTLRDVLNSVTEETGLIFIVPDQEYAKTPVPFVCSLGTGFALMDQIGDVFNIPNYTWQQRANGECFVGSWRDSIWASKSMSLPDDIPTSKSSSNFAVIPTTPKIRPGILLNGSRVRTVTIKQQSMELEWMS